MAREADPPEAPVCGARHAPVGPARALRSVGRHRPAVMGGGGRSGSRDRGRLPLSRRHCRERRCSASN